MQVTLIYNPSAGGENQPTADDLVSLIRRAGHSAICQPSNNAEWKAVLQESTDLIAVAGGDGIVGKVAKLLVGRGIPIAVLPMGTANNVAHALGLTGKSIQELIEGWNRARRTKFDVGVARGPWGETYFIEGVGVGLFSDTMSRLDARKNVDLAHLNATDDKITSVLEIMKIHLERRSVHKLKVTLDDRDLSGDYIMLEAMNIRSVGPNLTLAMHADPGDGFLDIVLIPKDAKDQLDEYLSDRIEKKSSSHGLTGRRGQHLRIECERSRIHIDDDVWPQKGTPPAAIVEVALSSESLEMLVAF